jgi:hypothetical protein
MDTETNSAELRPSGDDSTAASGAETAAPGRKVVTRAHGTRACYVAGPATGEPSCRCQPCRDANKDYQRQLKARTGPAFVPAAAARAHIDELRRSGLGLRAISNHSGVSRSRLAAIAAGKVAKVRHETQDAVLAVFPSHVADGALVDAEAVWAMVEDLVAAGVPKVRIAERLGHQGSLQLARQSVSARSARLVAEMHAEWRAGRIKAATIYGTEVAVADPRGQEARVRDIDAAYLAMVEALEARIDQRSWRPRAACRTEKTRLFFPGRGDAASLAAAKEVCSRCSVAPQCLTDNLEVESGVFGGLSGRERRELRAARAAADPVLDDPLLDDSVLATSTSVGGGVGEDGLGEGPGSDDV